MNRHRIVQPDLDVTAPPAVGFHVHGLTKIYRMEDVEVRALQFVDLDLYDGEFVVILGSWGSGKSTLLNILGGLDIPTSGHIFFHTRDITHANHAELTRFRGGIPSALDRLTAAAFGKTAVDLIAKGQSNQMVAWQNGQVVAVPIEQVCDRSPLAVNPDGDLVQTARALGIYVGE